MKIREGLSFNDVLLVPQHSKIVSRSNVDISTDLGKGVRLDIPIISANMKTVTGPNMAIKIAMLGGMAILHRFDTFSEQLQNYNRVIEALNLETILVNRVGISVGVTDHIFNENLISKTEAKVVCVDVAHGDHELALRATEKIANKFPNVLLIAGNVATGSGAYRLWNAGADVVKVGIGSGATCSTRIETGNGVPQLTAIYDCYNQVYLPSGRPKIISDGGCKQAGDVVKSLCFADCVMLGSMLAGTDEAPGEAVTFQGKMYKKYAGSSTYKTNHIEGVAGFVPYKGPVSKVIQNIVEGLKSGLSYQGCENLEELKENPEFIRITHAGLIESRPHAELY